MNQQYPPEQGADYEAAFGYAWAAMAAIAEDKGASIATVLQVQRAQDNLQALFPKATEGLER